MLLEIVTPSQRKSLTTIGEIVGLKNSQSLHNFITESPWSWHTDFNCQFQCFNVATGAIALATVEATRTEKDFEAHVSHLLQQFPQAAKSRLVMDCLNTHQSEAHTRLVAK
jgi:SRSO17 transposase